MAQGTIRVDARVILHSLLQLKDYTLKEVQIDESWFRDERPILIFRIDAPDLPEEESNVTLTPVYESRVDEDGTRWVRLKEVQVTHG